MSDGKILLEKGYVRAVDAKHGPFLYNRNDLIIGRSLEAYGEWCEPEIDLLLQCIAPGDLIVDVGANIGTHTVPLAKRVGMGGFVHAFEPQRTAYLNLSANVFLNGLLNVSCHHAAAGRRQETIRLPLLDPNSEQNFGAMSIRGFEEGEPVDIVTIDSLGLDGCALIKIDVEGMEVDVLTGAEQTINRFRPLLFVENNSREQSKSKEIIQKVLDLNYTPWWILVGYFNADNFFANPQNIFPGLKPEASMFCHPSESPGRIEGLQPVLGADDTWMAAAERLGDGGQG